MNEQVLDQIVTSLLYEGYILYPYRASSKKNQRERFTFGRIYPKTYSEVQNGVEACVMQTQCLVRGTAATVEASIRFLQPIRGGRQQRLTAVERRVTAPPQAMTAPPNRVPFRFERCEGDLEIRTEAIDDQVSKITVRITNRTPVDVWALKDPIEVLLGTFASTHTLLEARTGEFLSLLDPPSGYRKSATGCVNIGTWPVLVGDESKREADTMLSSPIILYDYPRLASQSPGDWYDGTEIDEMLALRVRTMTDEEKLEMCQFDDYARRILERAENLSEDELMAMHGTIRDVSTLDEQIFGSKPQLQGVAVGEAFLKAGDCVRIRPKARADVMDLALSGKAAVIDAVEQDAEGKVHLALVLQDDPGKDLGMMRQVGHRFFFAVDEVEPLPEDEP